jgi:hypothetical protein
VFPPILQPFAVRAGPIRLPWWLAAVIAGVGVIIVGVIIFGVIMAGCVVVRARGQMGKLGVDVVRPLDLPDHLQDGALRPNVAVGGQLELAAQDRLDAGSNSMRPSSSTTILR